MRFNLVLLRPYRSHGIEAFIKDIYFNQLNNIKVDDDLIITTYANSAFDMALLANAFKEM